MELVVETIYTLLGKGNFLLSKLVCNRQSDLTRLSITRNRLDKIVCRQIET